MNILLCGASGFVGRHLEQALRDAGHHVIRGVRTPRSPADVAIDYRNDTDVAAWLPRLQGVDAVVNAIGVLRDSSAQPMAKLHDAAPRALFAAAAQSGVQRIVQISALGAGSELPTTYMQSKRRADDFLQSLDVDWAILRPSLIYGPDGDSTRMFLLLSRLPLLMLPGAGNQAIQPVHIDDIAAAVVKLLAPATRRPPLRSIIHCVGADATTMAGLVGSYRQQRGSKAAPVLAVPGFMLRSMAWLGDRIPTLPVGSDTLAMLEAGSTADGADFAALLGRASRSYRNFLSA